jgi:hypothetical protein
MSVSATVGVGPVVYSVSVNGVPFGQNMILDANLHQSWGNHDLFFLRIEWPLGSMATASTIGTWAVNTPISIVWGRQPNLNTWYGYLNHSESTNNSDSGTNTVQMTYACIGTSMVMNSQGNMQWSDVSVTYVAKFIAQKYGFRAVTTPNGYVFGNEVQNNMSDFEFLKYLANKYGFRFWASNSTIYMIQPATALAGPAQVIPQFLANKSLVANDTLRDYTALQGANLPGAIQANRAVFALDSTTGQLYSTASNLPVTNRVAIKQDVQPLNVSDALAQVNGWSALNQFMTGASAMVYGDSTLYPGKLVDFEGGALPAGSTGYWLVTSTTHNMVNSASGIPQYDRYYTSIEVVRNSTSGMNLSNVQTVSPEFSPSVLASGAWQAVLTST